ncbi:MAG: hypothetical protein ACR2OJ_07960, partial [Hyphomicrobiales bacterium]
YKVSPPATVTTPLELACDPYRGDDTVGSGNEVVETFELSPYGDFSLTLAFSDESPPKEPVIFANRSDVVLHPAIKAAIDATQEIFKTRENPVVDTSTLRMITLHKLTMRIFVWFG